MPLHPSHPTPMLSGSVVDFQPRTRLVYGEGIIDQLGALVKEYGGRRALIVTDSGLVKAGHADRAAGSLSKVGVFVSIFDRVQENPTDRNVGECVETARKADVDFLIGLGGGSSMDTAKGANFIFTNGGRMVDYWGLNKAAKAMLPMIAVPTTAGTGSECQAFALIADEKTHLKMACGDEKCYPRAALLDPVLTLSLPPAITANTAVDAITHALESFVTLAHTPLSQVFAREAWRLLEQSLEVVLREPHNITGRGRMLLASAYAGMSIAQSMLGAAHSCANPLTAHYGIIHGQAVGLMLPHVMRFNSQQAETCAQYADLARSTALAAPGTADREAANTLIRRAEVLLNAAHIPASLGACGVKPETLRLMSEEAAKQWTANFNPRPLKPEDALALYQAAQSPRG